MSATSVDLRSARLAACRALEAAGHEPRYQERFEHGHRSLEEFLKDRISECQAMLCLAGRAFGAAPQRDEAAPRSYTQLEYSVARQLGLPVFIFIAAGDYRTDDHASDPAHLVALQRAHVESLRRSHKWVEFQSIGELRQQVEALGAQLPRVLPLVLREQYRPPPPPYFVGRARELEQLASAVRYPVPSVVAVVGMAGQGKTTLVDRWLREQPRLNWKRGIWISLDRGEFSFDRFLDVALAFLRGGSYDKRETPDPAARCAELIELLQGDPVLLVLDGIERWLRGWTGPGNDDGLADTVLMRKGQTELFDHFLVQTAALSNGAHLVLTSRALPAALDDVGCTIIPVRDESRPETALEGLEPDDAIDLLRRLGVRGSTKELAEAAAAYKGHPLALTVLAGLLRKLYGGLVQNLPEVTPLDPRRSLHTLLESTLRHLPSAPELERFLAVAAHALEDPPLGAICTALPGSADGLRTMAVTLADWNVVRWDGAEQIVRMHPLVRQFAVNRLSLDEARAVHARYSNWYAALSLPAMASSLEDVAPRLLAIEHAMRAMTLTQCTQLFFQGVNGGKHLLEWAEAFGHQSMMIELLGRAAEAVRPEQRPPLLIPRAALKRQLGRLEQALADLNEVLATPTLHAQSSAGDVHDMAGSLINRGNVLRQLSRPLEALDDFERALDFLEALSRDDPVRLAYFPATIMNRGLALREMGRFSKATADCERSVQEYRKSVQSGQIELMPVLSRALTNYGITLAELHRVDEALAVLDEAMEIQSRLARVSSLADVGGLAKVKISKASVLNDAGVADAAVELLDEVIEILQPLVENKREDLASDWALAILGRGQALAKKGEWSLAVDDGERAIRLYEQLIAEGRQDLHSWLAFALLNQAEARYRCGAIHEAAMARGRGLKLLEDRIASGEPETRVLYLRKSAEAAHYLAEDSPQEGHAVLERAVRELEAGLAADPAMEALRLEATRAVRVLEGAACRIYEGLLDRLRACES